MLPLPFVAKTQLPFAAVLLQTKSKAVSQLNKGLPSFYLAKDNETPRQIALRLGICPKALVQLNKRHLDGLTQLSKLKPHSKLRIPGPGGEVPPAGDWLQVSTARKGRLLSCSRAVPFLALKPPPLLACSGRCTET